MMKGITNLDLPVCSYLVYATFQHCTPISFFWRYLVTRMLCQEEICIFLVKQVVILHQDYSGGKTESPLTCEIVAQKPTKERDDLWTGAVDYTFTRYHLKHYKLRRSKKLKGIRIVQWVPTDLYFIRLHRMMLEVMSALQHPLKEQSSLDLLAFYIEEEGLGHKSSKGVGYSINILFCIWLVVNSMSLQVYLLFLFSLSYHVFLC